MWLARLLYEMIVRRCNRLPNRKQTPMNRNYFLIDYWELG